MIVVKLGGSLMRVSRALIRKITDYSNEKRAQILIVPGGSVFADIVRKTDVSQETAHWMAILAMEQYGHYLADGTDAKIVDSLEFDGNGTFILLSYDLLKKNDELPHSWDVTSDTIAAWVALKVGAARFIKVTDVDGVYIDGELMPEINAGELAGKETCLDRDLPNFLMKNKMTCEIVNGNCPGRVIQAFDSRVLGTVVKG
jgi:aspartokinase-like uncharacterized kinase